jgi:hypothetical protein
VGYILKAGVVLDLSRMFPFVFHFYNRIDRASRARPASSNTGEFVGAETQRSQPTHKPTLDHVAMGVAHLATSVCAESLQELQS